MAKIKAGILGPLSGKLGPVIGGTWKGIPYIRMNKEADITRKRSPAQLANEEKFKFVNDWLVPFHPFITIGFSNLAIGKTAIAAALKANYKTVFTGLAPNIAVAYDQFQLSSGILPGVLNVNISFSGPEVIQLTWEQNAIKGTAYNDQLMLVLYSEELMACDGFAGAVNRSRQQYNFMIQGEMTGKPLHAWLSLTSLERRNISDSIYLGIITP